MRTRKKWIMRRVERVRKSLLAWLEKNVTPASRPAVREATNMRFELIFPQLATDIAIWVAVGEQGYSEVNVWVLHDGDGWDIILWLDVTPVRKGSFHTCDLCCGKAERKYFRSQDQLYADHLWEPFWAWVQENFHSDKAVCLFQTQCGGGRWAEIVPESKIVELSADRCFVNSFPVTITRGVLPANWHDQPA